MLGWIRVPKVPFRVFDKLKNKIQNSILRFCFYLNMKKRNLNNWLPFSCLIDFYFEFLMPSFVFHCYKKMENELQLIFRLSFSWGNWRTKYLNRSRLTLWLFSQVCSTRYSRASSCQVPWGFPLCNGHTDTKNPLFRKQLMYFNVYIAGCYFHISKVIHKLFNCRSWFKI